MFAVLTQVGVIHIPLRLGQKKSMGATGEIDVGEPLPLGVAVGGDENAFAVLGEFRERKRDRFCASR